jgi:bifunctional DNA-binding transcriptional regulator/antitoxin component of YhaV-PrlF toxin-antitoxin module
VSYLSAMSRQAHLPSTFSKVSVKSQTVIPLKLRQQFGLKSGHTLRYRATDAGLLLDTAPANETHNPFATFSEWSNEVDEKAYGRL